MRQTPQNMKELLSRVKDKLHLKSLVIALSAIVVFTTTYMLILPAFTLDKQEAAEQGGIDVVAAETVAETADTEVKEEAPAEVQEDQKAEEKADANTEAAKKSEDTDKAEKADKTEKSDVKLLTKKKTINADQADGDKFAVSAVVGKDAKVPADVTLTATELDKKTDGFDYDQYKQDALKALKKDSDVKGIKSIKFYDISLESESQDAVEPEAMVNVKIAYEDGMKVDNADNIRIVHFAAQDNGTEKPVVLDATENKVETTTNANGSKVTEASFDTDGFSKYAVVEVTLDTKVITADGKTYNVEVAYEDSARIPSDASLSVTEIKNDSNEYKKAKAAVVAAKKSENDDFDESSLGLAAFDISIVDGKGNKIEPAEGSEVKVSIKMEKLPEGVSEETLKETMEVQHLNERSGKPVAETVARAENVVLGKGTAETQFTVDSFSTFTITWDAGSPNQNNASFRLRYTDRVYRQYSYNYTDYYYANVRIWYVDENGNNIQKPAGRNDITYVSNDQGNLTVNLDDFETLDGYEFVEARYDNKTNGAAIDTVNFVREESSQDSGDVFHTYYKLGASEKAHTTRDENRYYQNWFDSGWTRNDAGNNDTGNIYLVFKNNSEDGQATVHYGYIQDGQFVEFDEGSEFNAQVNREDFLASAISSSNNDRKATLNYTVPGYEYVTTRVSNGVSGTEINPTLLVQGNNGRYYFYYVNKGTALDKDAYINGTQLPGGEDIYVIYQKEQEGGSGGPDPADPDLDAPSPSKVLSNNGDGTYDLTLSIKGASTASTERPKADVVVILDLSTSMEGDRIDAAQSAIESLATELNKLNQIPADATEEQKEKIDYANTVHMALVTFGNDATVAQNFTKELTTRNNNNQYAQGSFMRTVMNQSIVSNTGTNWEAGLQQVSNITGGRADAQKYVIFISDGNPSFRNTYGGYQNNNNDNNSSYNDYYHNYGGGDDRYDVTVQRCYQEARDDARKLAQDGYIFYAVRAYGDAARMRNLVNYAYTGSNSGTVTGGNYYLETSSSDASSLANALKNISSDISRNFLYTDVEFDDGISDYTANVLLDGKPDNIVVKVTDATGQDVTSTEGRHVKPTFNNNNGVASLEFEDGYVLTKDYTYSATFLVWPKQEAYDRIAALNNGAEYTTDDANNGIVRNADGTYSLNTNTHAEVSYKIQTVNEDGTYGEKITRDPVQNIPCLDENGRPASIGLTSTGMYFRKLWYVGLQEEQFNRMKGWTYGGDTGRVEPLLHVEYTDSFGVTDKTFKVMPINANIPEGETSATWPKKIDDGVYETLHEKWSIATGIMVTELPDGVTPKATWTDGSKTYYVLETGHDYSISEDYISGNFEPVNETYHPMLVDGVLKNVHVSGTSISGMEDMNPELLTVNNWLRGGINITKNVKDANDQDLTVPDSTSEFTIEVTVNAPTPDAANYATYKDPSGQNDIQVVWYDTYANADDAREGKIMYNVNGKPVVNTPDNAYDKNLNYIQFVNGVAKKELTIKDGQVIRLTNLLRGSTYSIVEKGATNYEVSYDDPSGTIASNEEHNVVVTNKQKQVDVKFLKYSSDKTTPLNNAEFTLYKHGDSDVVVTDVEGINNGKFVIENGATGNTYGLVPGIYKLVETKSPDGYVIASDAIYFKVSNIVQLCDENGNLLKNEDGTVITENESAKVFERALTVYNKAGNPLPNSGGIGTTIFYILGSLLVIGCGVVLVSRRRMGSDK